MVTVHNGIICNTEQLWSERDVERQLSIDTEIIPQIVTEEKAKNSSSKQIAISLFNQCEGVICAAILDPKKGELLLVSNNGSLYTGRIGMTCFLLLNLGH